MVYAWGLDGWGTRCAGDEQGRSTRLFRPVSAFPRIELGRQQRGALGFHGAAGDGVAEAGELAFAVQHRALVPACGLDAQLAQAVGGDLDRRQPRIHVAQLERRRLVGVPWRRCWRG